MKVPLLAGLFSRWRNRRIVLSNRNYGIDLLRIIAMLSVILLHNLYQGGILPNLKATDPNWAGFWYLENLAIVAVNVFAMITGFVSVNHRFKSRRVLEVVLQAFFWSIVIALVLYKNGFAISWETTKAYFVPYNIYWYVNAYIGLFLLSPLLIAGVHQLSRQSLKRLIVVLVVISIVLGSWNQFFLVNGYSAFWLIEMFLIGAYLSQYPDSLKLPGIVWLIVYFAMAGVSLYFETNPGLFGFDKWYYIKYLSPIVVIQSIALFVWGSRLNIRFKPAQKLIQFFGRISFGAYLIDGSAFYLVILPHLFTDWMKTTPSYLPLRVLGAAVGMYLAFALLDYVRLLLFKLLHINKLLTGIDWCGKWVIDYI